MNSKTFICVLCVFVVNFERSAQVSGIPFFGNNETYSAKTLSFSEFSNSAFNFSTNEFPPDIFTLQQRRQGALILHLIGALYSFGLIGIVCGDYFLPSIDCICSDLKLSQDVAAATFMSFATTAPELFIIIIATFITKSDIGLGAVVGSGMFNILGVATIGGLAAAAPIKLDWWPLYRDSSVYLFAPIGLAIVVADDRVTLIESLCLIFYYFLYFVIMLFNRRLRKKIKSVIKDIQNRKKNRAGDLTANKREKTTQPPPTISLTFEETKINGDTQISDLNPKSSRRRESSDENLDDNSFKAYFINYEDSRSLRRISACSTCSNRSNRSRRKSDRSLNSRKASQNTSNPNLLQVTENLNYFVPTIPDSFDNKNIEVDKNAEDDIHVCDDAKIISPNFFALPEGTFWEKVSWFIQWPAAFLLHYTVPDCRFDPWRRFYPLTFLMCVFWIGVASYFGTWMITVMGETIGISESVMGLTFLALGGSMPEAISTFIMARQGEGGLGFSNSLGGNTMDICLCLGIPWLFKCLIDGPVEIKSEGLQYNSLALVIGIIVLLFVVTYTKFHLNKKMGIVCCAFYLIFIIVSALIELDIIGVENIS